MKEQFQTFLEEVASYQIPTNTENPKTDFTSFLSSAAERIFGQDKNPLALAFISFANLVDPEIVRAIAADVAETTSNDATVEASSRLLQKIRAARSSPKDTD